MKTKWVRTVPKNNGWYWCKYNHGKHDIRIAPCEITHFKHLGTIICVARGPNFPIHKGNVEWGLNKMYEARLRFGPAIPIPT